MIWNQHDLLRMFWHFIMHNCIAKFFMNTFNFEITSWMFYCIIVLKCPVLLSATGTNVPLQHFKHVYAMIGWSHLLCLFCVNILTFDNVVDNCISFTSKAVLNTGFVFTSAPNSGPNILFVFHQIVWPRLNRNGLIMSH